MSQHRILNIQFSRTFGNAPALHLIIRTLAFDIGNSQSGYSSFLLIFERVRQSSRQRAPEEYQGDTISIRTTLDEAYDEACDKKDDVRTSHPRLLLLPIRCFPWLGKAQRRRLESVGNPSSVNPLAFFSASPRHRFSPSAVLLSRLALPQSIPSDPIRSELYAEGESVEGASCHMLANLMVAVGLPQVPMLPGVFFEVVPSPHSRSRLGVWISGLFNAWTVSNRC